MLMAAELISKLATYLHALKEAKHVFENLTSKYNVSWKAGS